MNHFLLPQGSPPSSRFGEHAVPLLIEWVTQLGAHRSRLRAKLDPAGVSLRSIRGFGYRLELSAPTDHAPAA